MTFDIYAARSLRLIYLKNKSKPFYRRKRLKRRITD